MSVVGSVLAITVAILAGFPVATLVALACYLVALVHVSLDWRVGRVRRRVGLGRAGVSQPAGGGANR
jgi:type III secretory pathway component EscV